MKKIEVYNRGRELFTALLNSEQNRIDAMDELKSAHRDPDSSADDLLDIIDEWLSGAE